MAENKNSFLFYADWQDVFEALKPTDAGKLIQHILSYVNDENPPEPTGSIKMAWIPIKAQLKRDLKKWEATIEKRSKAGKASAEKRQHNSTKSTHVESVQHNPTHSTVDVNDNVDVNVNVNVNEDVDVDVQAEKNPSPVFGNQIFYDLETLKEKLLSDVGWIEISAMNNRTEIGEIEKAIPDFILHLASGDEQQKEMKDAKKHFNNWFKKKTTTKKHDNSNPTEPKINRTPVSNIAEFLSKPIQNIAPTT